MKKLFVSFILCGLLSACTTSPSESPSAPPSETPTETQTAFIEPTTKPIEERITRTMTDFSFPCGYEGVYAWQAGMFNFSTLAALSSIDVEVTRQIDEHNLYVVLRWTDDVAGDYYGYFFFRYLTPEEVPDSVLFDIMIPREEYRWTVVGRSIRVAKRLHASDFDGIAVGASIADVAAVDPITTVCIPDESAIAFLNLTSFDTFHYTEEGILRITFSHENEDEDFTVSEIELNPTFAVPVFDRASEKMINGWREDVPSFCHDVIQRINPEDLPR